MEWSCELRDFFFELQVCVHQGSDAHLNVCGQEKEEALIGPWQMPCKKLGTIKKPTNKTKTPKPPANKKHNKTRMHPGDEVKK